MTLEEAIKHAEATAIENEKEAKRKREHGGWYYDSEARALAICAEENRQLAEWLRELQERRKIPEVITCGECAHRYVEGENVRFNRCELNHNNVMSDDWYCADAERKTDGTR